MGRPRTLTTRESDQISLRLPDGMLDRLKAEKARTGRPTNAEIIARLEQSFEPGTAPASRDYLHKELNTLRAEMAEMRKAIHDLTVKIGK